MGIFSHSGGINMTYFIRNCFGLVSTGISLMIMLTILLLIRGLNWAMYPLDQVYWRRAYPGLLDLEALFGMLLVAVINSLLKNMAENILLNYGSKLDKSSSNVIGSIRAV